MKQVVRIKKEDIIFVAIDYQDRLLPAMENGKDIEKNIIKLGKGLKILGIPEIVTTQYSRGLGQTAESVAEALGDFEPVDKFTFSACKNEQFMTILKDSGRKTVILAGIETHICVEQTALDLLEKGYNVVLAADCCGSRDMRNHEISLLRLIQAGVVAVCTESVLYELLGSAKAPEFKEISSIVK